MMTETPSRRVPSKSGPDNTVVATGIELPDYLSGPEKTMPVLRQGKWVIDVIPLLSGRRTAVVFLSLSGITAASSITTGLLTVARPRMAADLQCPNSLLVW